MKNFMLPGNRPDLGYGSYPAGLEKVLKTELFDSLGGDIDTECSLLGARFDPDSNHIVADVFSMDIECKDLALSIPGVISIQRINGNISQ